MQICNPYSWSLDGDTIKGPRAAFGEVIYG